jgi:PAS domain S-box-containing protein
MQIQTLLISISLLGTLAAGLTTLFKKRDPETLIVLVLAAAILLDGTALLLYQTHILALNTLTAIQYLFTSFAATAYLLFCFYSTRRPQWVRLPTILLLLIEPVLLQIFLWVSPLHKVFFNIGGQGGDLINMIYVLFILSASNVILAESLTRHPGSATGRLYLAIAVSFFPFMMNLTGAVGGDFILKMTFLSLSYTVLLIGIVYGLFSTNPAEPSYITRNAVVEGMDDGWMVVDNRNIIIDLNRATEEMIGLPREKVFGQPIGTILHDWASIFKAPENIKELEMRRSVKSQNEWRYLNIRITKLNDSHNVNFGHLIVWRDITKRKMVDDARQRARDELFVLLNAISSAASHSMSLEEFLSESIYQIIYSFRSQAVAVYLFDENKIEGGQKKLLLKAQVGISPDYIKSISDPSITSSIMQWLEDEHEKQTLVVEDIHGDDLQIYPIIQNMGFSRIAMVPLVMVSQRKSEVLGCLCLARSDDIAFTQDEIIRLKTISTQITTLIDSDRRRQFAIAISERQRLMRDLHDSVSQKLYGLVALTEAAQAALEAGSEIAPSQVLARIGENARQAVKEMRLFLYEMQPVDLEDGLISVLHHRLAAVEGRADIKARLLVDEDFTLPRDMEIALYFITQEALNNILRHAHAKNVSITLKQSRQNVILEVNDDGRGFDPKNADEGGLGLRNMSERTMKMDGKFKVTSKPGKGTQISVTVPRNI